MKHRHWGVQGDLITIRPHLKSPIPVAGLLCHVTLCEDESIVRLSPMAGGGVLVVDDDMVAEDQDSLEGITAVIL